MKIYISCDIEGVSGVTHPTHILPSGRDYERARRWMTKEANAAAEGALAAGAKEIIVNDAHGSMTNLLIEEIHPAVQLITGSPKLLSMMEGIDHSFDAAIFVGYHSRVNTPGVLSHSYDERIVGGITLNGLEVGEFGLNAFLAGYYDVPVVAVTGDDILSDEVYRINPDIYTAIVKFAHGRFAARCLQSSCAEKLIWDTVKKALKAKNTISACKMEGPIDLEITFLSSGLAEAAASLPGTQQTAANKVLYKAENILEAYRARIAMTTIAGEIL